MDSYCGGYGYIEFMDERKFKHDGYDDQIEPEFRKPTPAEREEIVINYIKAHSGRQIKIGWLAIQLAVSDRTIQKLLRKLEKQGLIKIVPTYTKTGKQKGNSISYIGKDKKVPPNGLTLELLYDPDNPCGFRDYCWDDYKFILGYYTKDFTKEDASNQYFFLIEHIQELKKRRETFRCRK